MKVIEVKNLNKIFSYSANRYTSLRHLILNFNLKDAVKKKEHFSALKDISFNIEQGEFVGILGRNGSGKSTLLKIIAGIYQPTSGHIKVSGDLTPFIELGVGFNMELTGRENVYLNATLLGLTRKQIDSKYAEIVAFAELEDFMEQRLKNYSSGMQVRLAFSIAIQAQSEILLIDEVLAVGDSEFQKKCFDYFYKLKEAKKTVVFVSHDTNSMQRFCDRALLIHEHQLVFDGDVNEAISQYLEFNQSDKKIGLSDENLNEVSKHIETIKFNGSDKLFGLTLNNAKDITVEIELRNSDMEIGLALYGDDNTAVFGTNTYNDKIKFNKYIKYTIDASTLITGDYYFILGLFEKNNTDYTIAMIPKLISFYVSNPGKEIGKVKLKHSWDTQ